MSGFYNTVNNYFRDGKLTEARNTIGLMREFVNTPSFREIKQIEERRELNLAMIDTVSRLIDESIRTSNVTEEMTKASQIASDAVRERENAEAKVLALEAELNSSQEALQKTIKTLSDENTRKDQSLAEARDRTANELKSQAATFQQTIATNQQTINNLQSRLNTLTQQINAVRDTVAPPAPAPTAPSTGSTALDAGRQQANEAFDALERAFE
jgi:chromosome segregation ATPase